MEIIRTHLDETYAGRVLPGYSQRELRYIENIELFQENLSLVNSMLVHNPNEICSHINAQRCLG